MHDSWRDHSENPVSNLAILLQRFGYRTDVLSIDDYLLHLNLKQITYHLIFPYDTECDIYQKSLLMRSAMSRDMLFVKDLVPYTKGAIRWYTATSSSFW